MEKVDQAEIDTFRSMVESYWRALMPHSPILNDVAKRDKYFIERFSWEGKNRRPYWAIADGERIGFLMFRIIEATHQAQIHDFFIVGEKRRKGIGSMLVQELLALFREEGVHQIDLNVRVDNLPALEFWRVQGFDIALHRLRLYLEADRENDV